MAETKKKPKRSDASHDDHPLNRVWLQAMTEPWELFADPRYDLYCEEVPDLRQHAESHFCARAASIVENRLTLVWGSKAPHFVLTRPFEPIPYFPGIERVFDWLGRGYEVDDLVREWDRSNNARKDKHGHYDYDYNNTRYALAQAWPLSSFFIDSEHAFLHVSLKKLSLDKALEAKAHAIGLPLTRPAFWFQMGPYFEQQWPWQIAPLQRFVPPPPVVVSRPPRRKER